jgi:hypothetical protein
LQVKENVLQYGVWVNLGRPVIYGFYCACKALWPSEAPGSSSTLAVNPKRRRTDMRLRRNRSVLVKRIILGVIGGVIVGCVLVGGTAPPATAQPVGYAFYYQELQVPGGSGIIEEMTAAGEVIGGSQTLPALGSIRQSFVYKTEMACWVGRYYFLQAFQIHFNPLGSFRTLVPTVTACHAI